MEFLYAINTDTKEPIMLLNKHIGFDEEDGPGIDGERFAREIMALDQMKPDNITVWINSVGGSVMHAFSIFTAIQQSKTPVNTFGVGVVASSAATIFQAGKTRTLADYAILMFHNPFTPGEENENDNKMLETMRNSIVTMICGRSGLTVEACGEMLNATTWLNATDKNIAPFVDVVENTGGNINIDLKAAGPIDIKNAQAKAAKLVLNKLNTNQNKNEMKKVYAKLGLNESANEDAIIAVIDSVNNKLVDAQSVNATLKTENETLTGKITELETVVNTAKTEKENAEKEALKIKAVAMVKAVADAGKIINNEETINAWVDKAIADFDGVKALLDSLTVNATAPNLDGGETPKSRNMAVIMAEINAKQVK